MCLDRNDGNIVSVSDGNFDPDLIIMKGNNIMMNIQPVPTQKAIIAECEIDDCHEIAVTTKTTRLGGIFPMVIMVCYKHKEDNTNDNAMEKQD